MNEITKTADKDELQKLLDATDKEKPTPQAIHALRQYLSVNAGSCRAVGDLALQAKQQIINNALPKNVGAIMSLNIYMGELRDDLGYETGAAIEKMLIENIVLCWLRLHVCELRFEVNAQSNQTFAQGQYWERKLSSNQRRYLRAIEALARVRRLLKEPRSPAFNLLLAQQINNR